MKEQKKQKKKNNKKKQKKEKIYYKFIFKIKKTGITPSKQQKASFERSKGVFCIL